MYKLDNINIDSIRDRLLGLVKNKLVSNYNDTLRNIEESILSEIQLLENNWNKAEVRLMRDTSIFASGWVYGIEIGIKNKFKRYHSIVQMIPISEDDRCDCYWEIIFPTVGCYIQLEHKALYSTLLPILSNGIKRYNLKWFLHNTEGNIFKRLYNWWIDVIL